MCENGDDKGKYRYYNNLENHMKSSGIMQDAGHERKHINNKYEQ